MPVYDIRYSRRLSEARKDSGGIRYCRKPLYQGGGQRIEKDHVEDGHLDHPKLSRREDLRKHWTERGTATPVLRYGSEYHWRHRPERDRPRRHPSASGCSGPNTVTEPRTILMAERWHQTCLEPRDHSTVAAGHPSGQLREIQGLG